LKLGSTSLTSLITLAVSVSSRKVLRKNPVTERREETTGFSDSAYPSCIVFQISFSPLPVSVPFIRDPIPFESSGISSFAVACKTSAGGALGFSTMGDSGVVASDERGKSSVAVAGDDDDDDEGEGDDDDGDDDDDDDGDDEAER